MTGFNLDVKYVINSKQIWKTVKPCLTDKILKDQRTTLIENEKVVPDKTELIKTFNEYFSNIISKLILNALKCYSLPLPCIKFNKSLKYTRNKKKVLPDVTLPFLFWSP